MDDSQRQKRYSLSYRARPAEGSRLAEVAKWLNQMSVREKNEAIRRALLMAYLPLARSDASASQAEINRCYWEFEERLCSHRFMVRQHLNLKGQLPLLSDLEKKITGLILRDKAKKQEEAKSASSQNELTGEDKTINYRQYLEQLFNDSVD